MTTILTRTGRHFDFTDPKPRSIHMIDIAAGLSSECRYAGMGGFYSVAQHSVHCSEIVPPDFAFEALMHDAQEAYCKDIPTPLKRLLPDYQTIERRIEIALRVKFALPPECSEEVKFADKVMLATEMRDLLPADEWVADLARDFPPRRERILPWGPRVAFERFWQRLGECVALRRMHWDEILA